ncbi:Prophage endopeptidase tail [Bacteroides finegoldii]|uniref:Uncharacterized protein n=1 Tax=Bacteroides finegoldii CL09T03C10 TaxID=997888 RepID=K5CEE4_9BACE|nr:hypothetical protein [Bacteroides finegoldii]EKJ91759.1 hypothetical protein HMPREF1057_00594 [Bacteroides finegoldii CL09T03C10]
MDKIDIKDISGNLRFSTPINEGSKRKFLLMKEDYITLKFSLANPVYFQLGDGVDNDLGIFELVDLYKPAYNTTTGAYDYELRLDAYYWKWKNKKFFYTPETTGREAGWNLTAPLNVHLNVFLDNLKALGYKFRKEEFTYEIDNTVANTSKLVSYDNANLIDALTQMAETWECEWWITEHVIHFGRCEYSSPVDFKAGDLTDTENVNVNSMQRSDSQTTYATRVYAFGSTRNIPDSYRKSLIFDVKKVNGRDIADTARILNIDYFPSKVTYKEYYTASRSEGSGFFKPSYTEWILDTDLSSLAKSGSYKVISDGISINITTTLPQIGSRAFLPAGEYILKATYVYKVSGESKEVTIGNQVVSLSSQQQYEINARIDVPNTLEIDKNSSDLKVRTSVSVPMNDSFDILSSFAAYIKYNIDLRGGASADTSVTFLSGSNGGQTFEAVYNPDLLTGDNSNVIRLPEGVTASLGDRYTINNIIKGKVPDNYFSKDDKELTLNGVVQKRLMLPEGIPYVDAYRYSPTGERINIGDERYDNPDNVEMPVEEAIEEIVIFEDEYPKYIGSVSSISHEEKEEIDEETKKPTGNKYPIYTFKDNGLKNFTKDFLLEELHLIFQTGKLAGLDFALTLKESDNTGTTFEIVRNEDYGRALPDDVLFPQTTHMEDGKEVPADTYVLYGFDPAFISEQMMPESEQELLETTKKYVKKSMIDPSTYDCEMDADFIYNNGNIRTYEVGDKVNLINKAYFPEGRQSRIIGFEWPLDIPYDHPIYTVGETAAYSRIGEIESKLDNLTYKGHSYSGSVVGGGGTSVYVIGVNDKTLPSDRNVFSSRKSLATFLRKDQEDTTDYLLKLLGGIMTGKIELGDFTPGTLGSGGIIQVDADGKTYLEVDKAYFRMKAIFDSLVIKDAQHVSGEQIITNASIECTKVDNVAEFALYDVNGCELYDINGVQLYSSEKRYRCYFTADDGEKAILSQFVAGDFAMCRQFNIKAGVYDGVSNRYYWRYVMEVGDNYIDLSIEDCDAGSDIPQAGDTIIQLGNRTDVSRQNAIIMSSYGENAPLKQMLQGIDSYSLADKVILEEGFDRVTNQGYTKNYGRSYVGDRDKKSYLEYVPGSGLEARCSIKGISDDGNSVYDLRPDGTCFFGKMDPDSGKKTGIIQGVDCFIGGSKRTGIFAVVDDEVVFELDPVTKQYKFIGEVYSDKGKVGGFDIDSYILENKSGQNALIRITNDYRKTTAALGNAIPGITGFGCGSYFEASKAGDSDNRAVMIRATGSTYEFWGGGNRNICIDAVGGSYWRMNEGDHWCMPGVLSYVYLEVWYNGGNPTLNQKTWGNGIEFVSIGYEGASPGAGNNYIVIKYRCSHDRVMCIPQNMGMDWNGLSKWGLTPCVESINDIVVQANPPTRMARFTFWSNDGSKYIPNKSLYVFIGEPNNS